MKNKTFNQKLTLNKATVVNLSNEEKKSLMGGFGDTNYLPCYINSLLPECDTRDMIICGIYSEHA